MGTTWLIWLVVVLVGSLLPAASAPMRELDRLAISDKAEHFGAYFLLAVFLPFLFESRSGRVVKGALSLVALGFALEAAQFFAPGRSPDFRDGLADTLGVVVGIAVGSIVRQVLARSPNVRA